jgi:NAD(P)-dependent dehydrogenase (short-subunit alcohol dehydrogenase family)
LALAAAGMNIFGVHLDRKSTLPNVDRISAEIHARGREAVFFNVNAADETKRREVLDAVEKALAQRGTPGAVRILHHSLAFGTLKPYMAEPPGDALTKAQMDMTVDVMAHSLVYWAQEVVARRLMGRGGRIYAMTSAGGHKVWKTYGAVSAAKAALEAHLRQLAVELAPLGITANAIQAGVTDTPALRKIPGNERMIEVATAANPGGRLTTTADVAQAMVALSLPHTQWMSGNVIRVDGGEDIV